MLVTIALLVGCGSYDGGKEEEASTTTLGPPPGLSQSAQAEAFEATVYPVVTRYCGDGCHDSGARGAPFLFASSSLGTAYQVITGSSKVNLSNPAQSRVVRRPAADFHQCGSQCVAIGAEMLTAVEAWAAIVEASEESGEQLQVASIESREVAFVDGEEIENDERYRGNLIAFYGFKEGTGEIAHDTSGVSPAMDLDIVNAEWMGAYGLVMDGSRLRSDDDDGQKLYDKIAKPGYGTGQYSIEMWVNNANVTQENARILTYGRSSGDRNVSLHQQEYQYGVRNRSMAPGSELDGRIEVATDPDDQDAQETLQHVVITYDSHYGRRIYVDSNYTGDIDPIGGARLWNWNPDAELYVGSNRNGSNNFWRGQIRMLAIYKQALSQDQIHRNYLAGVGKRVVLSFDVGDWTGTNTNLEFSVTELDGSSYLFCQPTFVGSDLGGIRVKNIRVVVNPGDGVEAPASGQSFVNVDQSLSGEQDQVSRGCSVIPKGSSPLTDTFSVEFEELALFEDPIDPTVLSYEPSASALALPPEAGFRDFARINATMAELTGVDPLADRAIDPGVIDPIQDIYEEVKQQLPASFDVRSIVSSHQVGLTKLAFEYCVELVDLPTEREAVFGSEFEAGSPSFFESDVATAYGNTALADLMSERLSGRMLGVQQLDDQPLREEVTSDLDVLRDDLVTNCVAPCGVEETLAIAKGMCTAVLSSAPIMVH
ncbi:MAG: hypothetical protein ACI9QQ_000008 [Myxococcota bacterium]|jgi:hypothetical protein